MKRRAIITVSVVMAVLLGGGIAIAAHFNTTISTLDKSFSGVGESGARPAKLLRMLVVHGIGRHCMGYSHTLVDGIAKKLGLRTPQPDALPPFSKVECLKQASETLETAQLRACENLHGLPEETGADCQHLILRDVKFLNPATGMEDTSNFYPGVIRTQDYVSAAPGGRETVRLRLYELTWDLATRWAKSYYVDKHDRSFDKVRNRVNKSIKNKIINESISDAVLYLGKYRRIMQFPLLMSFCKTVEEISLSKADRGRIFDCGPDRMAEMATRISPEKFPRENEIVFITHSLGTRMIFDTLGLLTDDEFLEEFLVDMKERGVEFEGVDIDGEGVGNLDALNRSLSFIRRVFAGSTRKIFTLANQVPLLELGSISSPLRFGRGSDRADLGRGFGEFLRIRAELQKSPLQLVAFTDPDDLLSYNLKCWYYLHVLKNHEGVQERAGEDGGYYERWFERCNVQGNEKLWRLGEDMVNITDASVALKGFEIPTLFTDPAAAHSNYFQDDTIFSLIACGGDSESKQPKKCDGQWQDRF